MSLAASDLPDDVEALKAMLLSAHEALSRKDQELAHRDLMIEKLRVRLDKQLRDRFGSSAEGIEQLQLMLEENRPIRENDECQSGMHGVCYHWLLQQYIVVEKWDGLYQ